MTTNEILIRRGTRADAPAAWRLFQTHQNWANVWFGEGEVIQRRQAEEFFHYLFRIYPSAVAVVDDIIVGFAVSETRELGVLELMNVYVEDPSRGQGIGSALLKELEMQCHPLGICTLLAFSSDRYYPGKRMPTGLFQRSGWEVRDLGRHAEMYIRDVPLNDEEREIVVPVRQLGHTTVDDLERDALEQRMARSFPTIDLDEPELEQAPTKLH